jgi:arylsulfatase A-like enzyme
LGLAQHTLLIFTNDNGGERLSDNGPFRHHKATLWEGGIRVPGLLRWPGKIPKGKTNSQVCISMDFTATIAAACGVQAAATEPFDGIDLLPVLAGATARERDLFWRINQPNQRVRAVRSGKWKYILDGTINNMYDLSNDPGETRDLYYVYPDVAERLKKKLDDWERSLPNA